MTGAEQVKRAKDEVLIEQGKKNTKLIRCKSGSLRIEKDPNRGVSLRVLQAGAVVGDTAVIQEIGSATAYVITNEDCELEEISVHLLMSIFRNNPGLCLRFFRHMAMKLAEKLRDLNKSAPPPQAGTPSDKPEDKKDEKKPDSPRKVDGKKDNVKPETPKGKESTAPAENLLEKFHLPVCLLIPTKLFANSNQADETLVQTVDVVLKERIKKLGKLYIFQKHIVFEYHVFGMDSKDVITLGKVKQIKCEEKKGSLKIDGRQFTNIKDFAQVHGLLTALWEGLYLKFFVFSDAFLFVFASSIAFFFNSISTYFGLPLLYLCP